MNNKNKTILVLCGYTKTLISFRGAMLKAMVANNCRVIACGPSASRQTINRLADMNVEYLDVPFKRTGINPFADFESLWVLLKLFRKCKPDLILSYMIKPVIYGSLVAKLTGVKNIYSMITGLGYAFSGSSIKRRFIASVVGFLYKVSLNWNHKVFFQNPDDRNFFYRHKWLRNKEQAVLINGSGVDVDYFISAPFPEKTSFLLTARLISDKGIREYAQASRILKNRYPSSSFYLVGWIDFDNPKTIHEEELQSWVNEGFIKYLGRMDDVRPAISGCSIFVLPSYREGTPKSVLEAMSMSRPIITTDAPGCRETVLDGVNGFLVPIKNHSALVFAMEKFIRQPELIEQMGKKSRELAEKKYDVNKVNAVIMRTIGLSNKKIL